MGRSTGFKLGKISASLRQTVENKAREAAFKKLERRVQTIERIADREAKKIVERYIRKTNVIKSLLGRINSGQVGMDLQAEFGLKPAMSVKAVDAIVEILRESVRIDVDRYNYKRGVGSRLELTISALVTRRYKQELLSYGYPLRYISTAFVSQRRKRGARKADVHIRQAKYNIDWIRWLLEASRGIGAIADSLPDIRRFGITYKQDVVNRGHSRSGRAVMVEGTTQISASFASAEGYEGADGKRIRAGGSGGVSIAGRPPDHKGVEEFPYEFPKQAIPKSGALNFIDELASDQQFRRDVKAYVVKAISEYLEGSQ